MFAMIGVIVTIVALSISISFNAIQANALEQMRETRTQLKDHEVRIRSNTEALAELKFIRMQLDRIEKILQQHEGQE